MIQSRSGTKAGVVTDSVHSLGEVVTHLGQATKKELV